MVLPRRCAAESYRPAGKPLTVADQGIVRGEDSDARRTDDVRTLAQPEEPAPYYVFRASAADSGFITGETIAVTRGIVRTR